MHIRLEKKMISQIKETVDHGLFANQTEFIRDAIRKSLETYEKHAAIQGLLKLKGNARRISRKKIQSKELSHLFRKFGLD